MTKKYITHGWYKLPEFLRMDSFEYEYDLKLMHWQQIYYHTKKNRAGSITGKDNNPEHTMLYLVSDYMQFVLDHTIDCNSVIGTPKYMVVCNGSYGGVS